MKNVRTFKPVFICVLSIMFLLCCFITANNIIANAQENENSSNIVTTERDCLLNNKTVMLETENRHFLSNQDIVLSFLSNYEENISEIIYIENGFNVLSLDIDDLNQKRFVVELSYVDNFSDYSLEIELELENGQKVKTMLYGYRNEYGMFLSKASLDNARENFYAFALEQNIMTKKDIDDARQEFWKRSLVYNENEITYDNIHSENLNFNQINSTLSTSSSTTYLTGTLIWYDDNGLYQPLRKVKVEVYDEDPFADHLLGVTYTDNIGNYLFEFDNAGGFWGFEFGGYDLYIKVYAGDDNAMVKIMNTTDAYCIKSDEKRENVENGSVNILGLPPINMETDLGKAMQISQALLTARDYAKEMTGETPPPVTLYYPYMNEEDPGSFYNGSIYISGEMQNNELVPHSYASWDVTMHEYGHHIGHQLDIAYNANEDDGHVINANMCDSRQDKNQVVGVWAESWPTVFGMLAQDYYAQYLQNISYINDGYYDSYNFWNPFPIESNTDKRGEGCEASVIAVLWDIFDSVNETNDNISFSHENYWKIFAKYDLNTFSDFVNNFYEEYPEYTYALGQNLTYYKMATTAPVMTNSSSVSQTVPPTFTWTAQGGSTRYPNNSFRIVIFDDNREELLRTAPTTLTSYTLTQNEWQSALLSDGGMCYVAVVASQTTAPVTGGYISAFSSFVKPSAPALYETFTINASNRYTEKVVNLQPSQYIDYNVTLQSGTKLIQTFGTCDVVMEIYNSNGGLLYELDDEGYEYNPLATLNVPSNNTQYKIRVFLYDSEESGTVKLTITPAFLFRENNVSSISEYEDILEIHTYHNITYSCYCANGHMSVLRYSPPVSGAYAISLSSVFDNYLYVIDPRSTEFIEDGEDFNDDSAEDDTNAYLVGYFEEGVEYFIIFGQYNPNAQFINYDEGDDISVVFKYLG